MPPLTVQALRTTLPFSEGSRFESEFVNRRKSERIFDNEFRGSVEFGSGYDDSYSDNDDGYYDDNDDGHRYITTTARPPPRFITTSARPPRRVTTRVLPSKKTIRYIKRHFKYKDRTLPSPPL